MAMIDVYAGAAFEDKKDPAHTNAELVAAACRELASTVETSR